MWHCVPLSPLLQTTPPWTTYRSSSKLLRRARQRRNAPASSPRATTGAYAVCYVALSPFDSHASPHSRLKKIKCIQSRDSGKCEACTTARVQCRFRDREQYFAERGRLMSRNSSPSYNQNAVQRDSDPDIALSLLDPHTGRLSHSPSVSSSSPSPVTPQRPHHTPGYTWPPPEPYRSSNALQNPCVQIPTQQSWYVSGMWRLYSMTRWR